MDWIRRNLLKSGAAVTALAAASRVFAQQQTAPGESGARFYEKGAVRIRFEESGSGFPGCCSFPVAD